MHFCFDDDQLEFRSQLRAFAEKQCTPGDVRDAWSSELGWSRQRWSALSDMGVIGIAAAEKYGGLGLGFVDLVLVLEEAGRACLPEPVVETSAIGVPLLTELPGPRGEELCAEWLPRVSRGDAVVTVGLASMATVPAAESADLLLLEHRIGGAKELHAVSAGEIGLRPRAALDGTRRSAEVDWEPSASTLVASGVVAEALELGARDRAATATAAFLVGVADRMISMAAKYASERKQFGSPIGSFQAVKHQLADALVQLEFTRPLVYRAALSIDNGDASSSVHSSMAKAQASDAALLAARTALQVHGAIGYTWEHDLHLWMKRAWALAPAWGDSRFHRARILDALVENRG